MAANVQAHLFHETRVQIKDVWHICVCWRRVVWVDVACELQATQRTFSCWIEVRGKAQVNSASETIHMCMGLHVCVFAFALSSCGLRFSLFFAFELCFGCCRDAISFVSLCVPILPHTAAPPQEPNVQRAIVTGPSSDGQ